MTEQKLLNALKARQAEFALDALRKPQTRDTFEYGYRTGVVSGLEMAINTLLDLVKDERDGESDI